MRDFLTLPAATIPEAVENAYGKVIHHGITYHPRSQQKMIGPSEIGGPCQRRLLYKLAQVPDEAGDTGLDTRLEAPIGTAFHSQLEEWFTADNEQYRPGKRWLLEEKVMVGTIGGQEVWGSTDLFDTTNGVVIDHKVTSPKRLKAYKANGPSRQYKIQGNLYGRGWALDGWAVKGIAIAFIPRDGTLRDIHLAFMPYEEEVALEALENANRLHALVTAIGLQAALPMFPPCQGEDPQAPMYNGDAAFCPVCNPAGPVRRAPAVTTL